MLGQILLPVPSSKAPAEDLELVPRALRCGCPLLLVLLVMDQCAASDGSMLLVLLVMVQCAASDGSMLLVSLVMVQC